MRCETPVPSVLDNLRQLLLLLLLWPLVQRDADATDTSYTDDVVGGEWCCVRSAALRDRSDGSAGANCGGGECRLEGGGGCWYCGGGGAYARGGTPAMLGDGCAVATRVASDGSMREAPGGAYCGGDGAMRWWWCSVYASLC